MEKNIKRREFIGKTGAAITGAFMASGLNPLHGANIQNKKSRVALVGTGIRGISFWGKSIVDNYSDMVEYVGLCDINPGRLAVGKEYMNVSCPTFTNFEEMMKKTRPDVLIVTTVDANHDEFIIKGMEMGADIITEKPMTTDEDKCAAILEAEKKTGKKVTVGFNYRYGTLFSRIKEELEKGSIGQITSVDFHWYLNVFHGASYFRRWHGESDKSGTLWVHKSTHHFDLLNWYLDSDPVEVMAYGDLEHYGKKGPFRGKNCRSCEHSTKCQFHWDITKSQRDMKLYAENEKYDGYIRDNCLFRENIDIYDKMSAQIKYANGVIVNYSLTTYSPYEGWQIGFNGFKGRLDSWEDLPWRRDEVVNQAELHAKEMSQDGSAEPEVFDEIMLMENFGKLNKIKVPRTKGGHGGGDRRLHDKIFKNPNAPDPYKHSAGTRDGAMSVLVGVAARKSIETGKPVKISELTDIQLMSKRP